MFSIPLELETTSSASSGVAVCRRTIAATSYIMADAIRKEYYESSKLAKYPFEPYWPEKKLRICVTGAGGECMRKESVSHSVKLFIRK